MHHAWQTCPLAFAEGRILSSDEETAAAATVRADIVSALHDQREMIEPFLTMPWDVYCRNMASSGTWGGAEALELAERHALAMVH
jgi:OTU-like cysteine protease